MLVLPKVPGPQSNILGIDKVAHFLLFFIFALLYLWMTRGKSKNLRFLLGIAFIISILAEIIQIPIPGREFCIFDILANLSGFITALAIHHKKRYRKLVPKVVCEILGI
jgi:VanZ family protein